MSGLIFLLALVLSLWSCIWIAKNLSKLVPNQYWRRRVTLGVFLTLLASPFVDEVIGKYQFESLCKDNGIESADVSKAKGRKVKAIYGDRKSTGGTIMPISVSEDKFIDANSGEVVIRSKDYYASGGWLMRYTPLSMGSADPMLFDGNGCGLIVKDRIFSDNQIVQIN